MDNLVTRQYKYVIEDIAGLPWHSLDKIDLIAVATAYYYFSIQFRENLTIAARMFPDDEKLQHLKTEECNTANLSPWPGVASPAERMNHDEFMRRTLLLSTFPHETTKAAEEAGKSYLKKSRSYNLTARACSIASYEDGGLETTFRAILAAPQWGNPALAAFRHFLVEHIRFDSDPEQGHGALCRHLQPGDQVLPMWEDFRELLICATPRLAVGVRYASA